MASIETQLNLKKPSGFKEIAKADSDFEAE
jgi:hypothetical protein